MDPINCMHVEPNGKTCRRVAYNRLYYCRIHSNLYPDAGTRKDALRPSFVVHGEVSAPGNEPPAEQQTPTHEQFECPRGCGTMSYEETQVDTTFLSAVLFFAIPVLTGIYFIGSFIIYDHSAVGPPPPHPHMGILVLFGVAWIVSLFSGIINSKTHHCNSCRGTMLEEKEMAYIFDEPSLAKLNSLIDSIVPSSSDLQCPICDEKMGTFSVPYIPADDNRQHIRRHRGVGLDGPDEILVGLALNLVVSAVKAAIPNAEETMDLDSCVDCRVIWFDGSEKNKLGYGTIN